MPGAHGTFPQPQVPDKRGTFYSQSGAAHTTTTATTTTTMTTTVSIFFLHFSLPVSRCLLHAGMSCFTWTSIRISHAKLDGRLWVGGNGDRRRTSSCSCSMLFPWTASAAWLIFFSFFCELREFMRCVDVRFSVWSPPDCPSALQRLASSIFRTPVTSRRLPHLRLRSHPRPP